MQAVVQDRWWAVRGLIRDCFGASLGLGFRRRRRLGGKWCRIVSYTHCNQPVTRQTSKEVHHTDSSTEALTWTLTANVGETVVFQVSSLEQLLLLPSAKRRAFNNEKQIRDRTQVSKHSAFVIADERQTQQLAIVGPIAIKHLNNTRRVLSRASGRCSSVRTECERISNADNTTKSKSAAECMGATLVEAP